MNDWYFWFGIHLLWRIPLWMLILAFGEWGVHYIAMHRKASKTFLFGWRILDFIYEWHHIQHHAKGQNELRPHIDLTPIDYFIAYPFLALGLWRWIFYGSPGGAAAVVAIVLITMSHMMLWNLLHRNMHDTGHPNFIRHWSWFPAFAQHHADHHAHPFYNYNVVYIGFDSIMGTKWNEQSTDNRCDNQSDQHEQEL